MTHFTKKEDRYLIEKFRSINPHLDEYEFRMKMDKSAKQISGRNLYSFVRLLENANFNVVVKDKL